MKKITVPPLSRAQIDEFYFNIQYNIDHYGFHLIGIMAGQHTPPFTYTIGVSETLGYEVLMCGLRNDFAAHIIADYVKGAIKGKYAPDCIIPAETLTNHPLMVAKATKELEWLYSEFTVQIERFYNERKPVVQLIMADKQGRLPVDQEFDIEYMARFQPIFCEVT